MCRSNAWSSNEPGTARPVRPLRVGCVLDEPTTVPANTTIALRPVALGSQGNQANALWSQTIKSMPPGTQYQPGRSS
ncbi:hypothetical protein TUN199_08786 [Pyrenophora tritici-repentis]|nr:hypothetical protein TUN199_08786 [Pyrenophora tritici-repentis]